MVLVDSLLENQQSTEHQEDRGSPASVAGDDERRGCRGGQRTDQGNHKQPAGLLPATAGCSSQELQVRVRSQRSH